MQIDRQWTYPNISAVQPNVTGRPSHSGGQDVRPARICEQPYIHISNKNFWTIWLKIIIK